VERHLPKVNVTGSNPVKRPQRLGRLAQPLSFHHIEEFGMRNRLLRLSWWHLVATLVLLMSIGLFIWKFDAFQVGTAFDDADYILLTKSLVSGPAYGFTNTPGLVVPTRFPFGWPVLLAPVYALTNGDLQALRLIALIFSIANVLFLLLGWRYLGLPNRTTGLLVAALYGLSSSVVAQVGIVMSEPAFLFFVLTGLALTMSQADRSKVSILGSACLGIALFFAFFLRTVGFVLVMALVGYLLWKRRWQTVTLAGAVLCVAIVFVVAVTPLRASDLFRIGEYDDQLQNPNEYGRTAVAAAILPRLQEGIQEYVLTIIPDALAPLIHASQTRALLGRLSLGFVPPLLAIALLALLLIGLWADFRRLGLAPTHLFVLGYLAVILVWPWRKERFLYPILPFLFALLLAGVTWLAQAIGRRLRPVPASWLQLLTVLLVVLWLGTLALRSVRLEGSLQHVPDLRVGTTWLREHAPPDALVIAEHPRVIYRYAERATAAFPNEVTASAKPASQQPTYVLLMPELRWRNDGLRSYSARTQQWADALTAPGSRAKMVFQDMLAKVLVFEIDSQALGQRNAQ
jgi:hypothetical protein